MYSTLGAAADDDAWPTHLSAREAAEVEAVFEAVEAGDAVGVEALLRGGERRESLCNAARTAEDDFPLYVAAGLGDLETVEALLRCGASVSQQTSFGHTALHAAALFGHEDVLLALLDSGEEAGLTTMNAEGQTLLEEVLEDAAATPPRSDERARRIPHW